MSDTREYIIDQAYNLFLNSSYEAVSISDISKAIGFTKGALYHHFVNKEELFKAVLDKYLLLTTVVGDINLYTLKEYNDKVLECVRTNIDHVFGNKPQFVPINYLTLIADGFRHYPNFAREKELFFNAEINRTKLVLENAVKRGEIRADINSEVIAMTYFSITIGLAGNLLQNYSLEETINSQKSQFDELYKLLKV